MSHIENNELASQLARLRAARARMGMRSAPKPIVIPEPKDIVQTPIQRLVSPLEAANRKRAMVREAARREKAERDRVRMEADATALLNARLAGNQKIWAIILATAKQFALPSEELLSDRRVAKVSLPRQVAMYLSKELTTNSFPAIGRRFRRDHTTVLHACQKIKALLAKGHPVVTLAIAAIKDALNGGDPDNYWGA